MNDLPKELKQHIMEAAKDTAWAEKLHTASAWEDYVKLLAEKGIEAPEKLKGVFEAGRTGKTGELADDELERVSGGFSPTGSCPQEYNHSVCGVTNCPHMHMVTGWPYEGYFTYFCDLYYWEEVVEP